MLLSARVGQLIESNAALRNEIVSAPSTAQAVQKVVEAAEKQVYMTDRWLYRWAVVILGLLALAAAIGGILLAAVQGGALPESVVALGSTAVGALVGLFAPSPTNR